MAGKANLLDQTGRAPEAEPLFRAGLEGVRKRFGAADLRTAGVFTIVVIVSVAVETHPDPGGDLEKPQSAATPP
jgi:hypothetical protein